jgi:intracellular multiplication protein IcmL
MPNNNRKKSGKGLELVVVRNAFYRDNYYRVLFGVLLLLLINVFLVFIVYYKWSHPPEPQYFPATADGRIIKMHSLSKAVYPDDYVMQWAADSVRKAFSLDYIHWKEQLQDALTNFTASGRRNFIDALKKTNDLKTLVDLKMVSNIKITGAPQVMIKTVTAGHYAWNINIPMLLTFTNGSKTINLPMSVTVIVLRESAEYYPQKIAINNFFASTQ